MVFSREATGRKLSESYSEKHSHLPEDLSILTFSRTKGKETKDSRTSVGLTFFVILGQSKWHENAICEHLWNERRLLTGDLNLMMDWRFRIFWKNFRVGK